MKNQFVVVLVLFVSASIIFNPNPSGANDPDPNFPPPTPPDFSAMIGKEMHCYSKLTHAFRLLKLAEFANRRSKNGTGLVVINQGKPNASMTQDFALVYRRAPATEIYVFSQNGYAARIDSDQWFGMSTDARQNMNYIQSPKYQSHDEVMWNKDHTQRLGYKTSYTRNETFGIDVPWSLKALPVVLKLSETYTFEYPNNARPIQRVREKASMTAIGIDSKQIPKPSKLGFYRAEPVEGNRVGSSNLAKYGNVPNLYSENVLRWELAGLIDDLLEGIALTSHSYSNEKKELTHHLLNNIYSSCSRAQMDFDDVVVGELRRRRGLTHVEKASIKDHLSDPLYRLLEKIEILK